MKLYNISVNGKIHLAVEGVHGLVDATAAGFAISIVILAGIRERMEHSDIPKAFQGMPIVLIAAGLMAIAFSGFAGLQIGG